MNRRDITKLALLAPLCTVPILANSGNRVPDHIREKIEREYRPEKGLSVPIWTVNPADTLAFLCEDAREQLIPGKDKFEIRVNYKQDKVSWYWNPSINRLPNVPYTGALEWQNEGGFWLGARVRA